LKSSFIHNGEKVELEWNSKSNGEIEIISTSGLKTSGELKFILENTEKKDSGARVYTGKSLDGKSEREFKAVVMRNADEIIVLMEGERFYFIPSRGRKKISQEESANAGEITSPMPGKIIKILFSENAPVEKGDLLLVLEAMKMEHNLKSAMSGKIEKIHVSEGDQVKKGETLVKVSPD